jgi:hypothetical protein
MVRLASQTSVDGVAPAAPSPPVISGKGSLRNARMQALRGGLSPPLPLRARNARTTKRPEAAAPVLASDCVSAATPLGSSCEAVVLLGEVM